MVKIGTYSQDSELRTGLADSHLLTLQGLRTRARFG